MSFLCFLYKQPLDPTVIDRLFLLQSLLQEIASSSVLQHNALHIQHGDNDEREGEHTLLIPSALGHVWVHGKEPYASCQKLR